MMRLANSSYVIVFFLSIGTAAMAQQFADPEFDAKVDRPAFTDRHPVVFIDEAHNNFHTGDGRYKPFADLSGTMVTQSVAEQGKVHARGLEGLCDPRRVERPGLSANEKPGGGEPRVRGGRVRCRPRLDQCGGSAVADRRPSSLGRVERRSGKQAGRRDGQEHDT